MTLPTGTVLLELLLPLPLCLLLHLLAQAVLVLPLHRPLPLATAPSAAMAALDPALLARTSLAPLPATVRVRVATPSPATVPTLERVLFQDMLARVTTAAQTRRRVALAPPALDPAPAPAPALVLLLTLLVALGKHSSRCALLQYIV